MRPCGLNSSFDGAVQIPVFHPHAFDVKVGLDPQTLLQTERAPLLLGQSEHVPDAVGEAGGVLGGRNQQFALAVASRIAGHPLYAVLAAGTDGTDGNTMDAGAIVDGETVARANTEEIDVDAALAGCDAGTALEASGDLLNTGPTGTNVGDLVIGLRLAAADAAGVTPSADPGPEHML